MKISDKELDDLFNSKLNDFEIEPNAALWDNIAAGLNHQPKKKSIVPVLRIAASIIVILSVGLLFLRKNGSLKNQLPQKVVKLKVEHQQPLINQKENVADKKNMLLLSAKNKVVKEASALSRNRKQSVLKTMIDPKPDPNYTSTSTQTFAQNKPEPEQQHDLPVNNLAQAKIAVVPDASVSLKVQSGVEMPLKESVKPPVLAVLNGKAIKTKHKGIRSMGDLVNLVMAKVDKREDKLIQFTDNDDGDESNVTGINLGIISIKKEK